MEFWFILLLILSMNPLLMILLLIIFLLLSVILISFVIHGYFFSYLIFLLFMSGLVMLLMYFCSVILNEKFILFFDNFFVLIFIFVFYSFNFYLDLVNFSGWNFCLKALYLEFLNLTKYLIYSYTVYSCFFIVYLLFCLTVVYEVTKKCAGPLRMKT